MDRLPPELLQAVLSHLGKRDGLTSRFTNRAFATASCPAAFKHIYICCFPWSFNRLHSLANSRHAKHVKTLTLYLDHLPGFNTEQLQRYVAGYNYTKVPPDSSAGDWTTMWLVYKRYLDQQDGFLKTSKWRSMLAGAVAALPNLHTIDVLEFYNDVDLAGDRIGVESPSFWMYSEDTISAARGLAQLVGRSVSQQTDDLAVAAVLDAMHQRATGAFTVHPIRKFKVAISITEGALAHRPFDDPVSRGPRGRPHRMLPAVAQIESLSIWLEEPVEDQSMRQCDEDDALNAFWLNLTQLKELNLRTHQPVHWDDLPDFGEAPYSRLFSETPPLWPKLESLTLSTDIRTEDMITFMHSHNHTLKSLDVSNCRFDKPKAALSEIPKALRLSDVEVRAIGLWLSSVSSSDEVEATILPDGVNTDQDETVKSIKMWLLTGEGQEPEWSLDRPDTDVQSEEVPDGFW